MKLKWVAIGLGILSATLAATPSAEGILHCIPNQVQFNAKGEMHFGAADNKAQIFLVRSQYDTPLVLDFSAGHIGASAGLTQRLGPRAWTVYVYKPKDDTLRVETGRQPPLWSCAVQDALGAVKLNDCQKSVWTCALTPDAAKTLMSVQYQQQAKDLSHSFWLPLGDTQYQSVYFLTDLQK